MRFAILGPLEVHDGERLVPLPSGKQRTLLALLLLRANEVVSAEYLLDELWEGRPPRTAGNTLQVYVSRLRKALGGSVERVGGGYVLRVDDDDVDLGRFRRFVGTGRLHDALALWRGAPLADVELPLSTRSEIARLDDERLGVLEARLDADLASGGSAALVPELEALVEQHPLRERLRAQLMLALYRAGRQADALEVFRRTREMMVAELGVEPGRELQELERAVLRQDPSLAPPPDEPSARLPAATTPLVGRDDYVENVRELLTRPDVRLVTLTGAGGIGKTRLALEVARGAALPVRYVALDALADPELVLPALVDALGVSGGARTAAEAVYATLGDRELLLVVDNFEHVLDAATEVADLLLAAPGLKVLATSRAPLRVSGEHEVDVPPLGGHAARELFLQRARAVGRAPLDETAVDAICARLECLPLAIELAAARTKLLPAETMLDRLESRLDLLTGGPRDAPSRQRTLRTTIDWSYDLLEPGPQRLFARLAVFAGGCTLASAEAVCEEPDMIEAIGALVDESLLRVSSTSPHRFTMLETVREYALERLAASGDEDELRLRHARHFAGLAAAAEPELSGSEQKSFLDGLEAERANLRAALGVLVENDPPAGLRMAVALRRFWQLHGHLEEGARALEEAIDGVGDDPSHDLASALNGAGILAGERGDYASARSSFERSLRLARRLEASDRIVPALTNLANLDLYADDLSAARLGYEEVAALARAGGHLRALAVAEENLGIVAMAERDLARALSHLETSLDLARGIGDPHQVALTLRELGRALHMRSDVDAATGAYRESLATMHELGQRHGAADALEGLAAIAATSGAAERAARLFGAAAGLRAAIGAQRLADQQTWFEQAVDAARTSLGEERYAREFDRGLGLPLDEAVALALE